MLGDPMRSLPCLLLAPVLAAQTPEVRPLQLELRASWQTLRMPTPGERMGLVGVEFLRVREHGLAWGLGGYGALTGIRGGFITVGLAGAWRPALSERLSLDLGAFCGGGGAGRADVGGGWMLEGHAGLEWRTELGRLGLATQRIAFPNGAIDSRQWRLSWGLPFTLREAAAGAVFHLPEQPWREVEVAATAARYRPRGGFRTDGRPERDLDLVGIRTDLGLAGGAFASLELAGAHGGDGDGYMEALLGAGWGVELGAQGRGRVYARVAGGPAGGGRLDVGGGMAWKGALGAQVRLGSSTRLGVELGRFRAPGGTYRADTVQLALGHTFGVAMDSGRPAGAADTFTASRWWMEAGLVELSGAQRGGGTAPAALRMADLRVGLPLGPHLYLAGEAAFGTSGRAGGYAEGLLGLGLEAPPLPRTGTACFAELCVGAAGGGGVDTRGGAFLQPALGLRQPLGSTLDLVLRVGRTRGLHGGLDTPMAALALRWKVDLLSRRAGA